MTGHRDARAPGPVRLPAMCVEGRGPYYANLIEISSGVLVDLCRSDRPPGRRRVASEVYDAPFFHVAHLVHGLVREANRLAVSTDLSTKE